MTNLLGVNTHLPIVVEGKGVFLKTGNGDWLLDGSSGALAASLGHGREDIAKIMMDQAATVAFVHRTQLRNQPAEQLADLLRKSTPESLTSSVFVSSGSDAVEAAIRLSATYAAARGEQRHVLVASEHCYHGVTLGGLSLTSRPSSKRHLNAILPETIRLKRPGASEVNKKEISKSMNDALANVDMDRVAAIIVEVISGGSGGVIIPSKSYLEELRQLCHESGALLVFDEVMTGFGRTGEAFALDHFGVSPDILVFGKGIGGGYVPLAGLITSERIAREVEGFVGVGLGHTFSNTPLSASVGLAAAKILLEPSFLTSVQTRGNELRLGLVSLTREYECISGFRGIGLMFGVDLKDPGLAATSRVSFLDRVVEACRECGLLVYPATPQNPSTDHATIILAPPLVISADEIQDLLGRLDAALSTVIGERPAI